LLRKKTAAHDATLSVRLGRRWNSFSPALFQKIGDNGTGFLAR
jgi:hypothetical protein